MLHLSPVRHTIASLSTALFETVLFALLVHTTSITPTIINPATILIGTTANFCINKYWVFSGSKRAWHHEAMHFMVISVFSLFAQSLLFTVIFKMLHMAIMAKLIALALGFLLNYPLKRWVFGAE